MHQRRLCKGKPDLGQHRIIASAGFDDPCRIIRYEMDGQRYPNRIILGTETYPPEIARNWDCVLHMNHVIGDFTWAGWDYLGEAGVGIPGYVPGEGGFMADFPAQLPYVGDFDLTGRRRPASYYREIVFGLRTADFGKASGNIHRHPAM